MGINIIDILISIVTGVFSSLIVALIFQKWLDFRDFKRQFDDDKQILCRYTKQLLNELMNYERTFDDKPLMRLVENEPFRSTFDRISEDEKNYYLNSDN